MEAPQINISGGCPPECQATLEMLNGSLRRAAEAVTEFEDPNGEIAQAVRFRDEMNARGEHNPQAEAKIDVAHMIATDGYNGAVRELKCLQDPVRTMNAMAACAFGGCKVQKGGPLIEQARRGSA